MYSNTYSHPVEGTVNHPSLYYKAGAVCLQVIIIRHGFKVGDGVAIVLFGIS